jgi:Ca2+-binding RTX toxin-like protein
MKKSRWISLAMVSTLVLCFGHPAANAQEETPMCFGREATMVGTPEDDVLVGGRGSDVIVGRSGRDEIRGGEGHDFICGGKGGDTIHGGPGNDRALTGRGYDEVHGGGGRDRLQTPRPNDGSGPAASLAKLLGGVGDDILRGDESWPTVAEGGPGDDLVQGSTASFRTAGAPVTVDLKSQTASGAGTDRLRGVRGVQGSAYGDHILTAQNPEVVRGYQYVDGRGGDDTIEVRVGSAANVDGGPGNDFIEVIDGKEKVRPKFRNEEFLIGSRGSDTIIGNRFDDLLDGREGRDLLRGRGGNDYGDGGDGHDRCEDIERRSSCEESNRATTRPHA